MNPVQNAITQALSDVETFSRLILKRPLRAYQAEPARSAIQSAIAHDGEQYVWRFPRQSGKNETIAHVHAYLLFLYQRVKGASIVHTAPTFDPQCKNAMRRVLEITANNPFFKGIRASGNSIVFGQARLICLSGMERDKPNVGSTASLMLSKDECQDLSQAYIEQAFDPMTANTNAVHVHTGTARHTGTYLAAKRLQLEKLELQDGKRRVYIINWRDVARTNSAYGQAVEATIRKLGPLHPSVQTEYENIETEQTGRLFDDRRIALIQARSARVYGPEDKVRYVATIDVGGTDLLQQDKEHDMTIVAIHQVDTVAGLNAFTTVDYLALQGANVLDDTPERRRVFDYLDCWKPLRIVSDSTGLGVGLCSAMIKRYQQKVVPFQFTASSKTDLLNNFLALIETGRYHHYDAQTNGKIDLDHLRFFEQLRQCEHVEHSTHTEWGIPAHVSWRHPVKLADEPLHDDHLLSVSLVGVLADAELQPRSASSTPAPKRATRSRQEED